MHLYILVDCSSLCALIVGPEVQVSDCVDTPWYFL